MSTTMIVVNTELSLAVNLLGQALKQVKLICLNKPLK